MNNTIQNTTETRTAINYNFIPVPTNLFILLDYRLKLVLTSLIQVSNALATSDGWFFYSVEDLKKVCGLKSDKTIRACIETLYRLEIVQVKSRTFKNNIGEHKANYYRLNTSEIKRYEDLTVYDCLNRPELQIAMLDYTSSDYQTTYTASTEEIKAETSPVSVENTVSEETPSREKENVSEPKEMVSELDCKVHPFDNDCEQDEILDIWYQSKVEMAEDEPVSKYLSEEDLTAPAQAMTYEDKVNELLDSVEIDKPLPVIETASVEPATERPIETRSFKSVEHTDEDITRKCYDLVSRYVEMSIPTSNESLEKCNSAIAYITDKFNKGYISEDDKKRLVKTLIEARFKKFSV